MSKKPKLRVQFTLMQTTLFLTVYEMPEKWRGKGMLFKNDKITISSDNVIELDNKHLWLNGTAIQDQRVGKWKYADAQAACGAKHLFCSALKELCNQENVTLIMES